MTPETDNRFEAACQSVWDKIVSRDPVDLDQYAKQFTGDEQAALHRVARRAQRFASVQADSRNTVPAFPENFRYIGRLGSGAMGSVFLCEQTNLQKLVAVKFLNPDPDQERLIREARLAARIHSPNVVQVFDLIELSDRRPMIVMEYVNGDTLHSHLTSSNKTLSEESVVEWMLQAARGMRDLAEQGIIHRDLKPANILITRDDVAKIADFGLARHIDHSADLTATGQVLGTPHYMSPEQATDPSSSNIRSDIYSFGATFYHALIGAPPFVGRSAFEVLYKHKTEPLTSPRALNTSLSAEISRIIERCLAKEPSDRYESFHELLQDLNGRTESSNQWRRILQAEEEAGFVSAGFSDRIAQFLHPEAPRNATLESLQFGDSRELKVVTGDIVEQQVEALVSSDDNYLTMGGGVSRAIAIRAGRHAVAMARELVPVLPGRVVVTTAGELDARFILHAVTLRFFMKDGRLDMERNFAPTRYLVLEILRGCQYHIETLQIQSIALPLLGTGAGWLAPRECLETMLVFFSNLLRSGLTPLKEVRLVVHHHPRWEHEKSDVAR